MIRFQCPDCAKNLSVPDTHAGKIGVCPACQCRIQLPEAPPAEDPDVVDDFVVDEPPPPKPKPKASPIKRKEDVEDRPVRRRRPVEDDDESPVEVRRKKKKKRRRREEESEGVFGGMDPVTIGLIAAAVIGVLSLIPAFIFPAAALLPIGLGWLMSFVGGIWFLVLAFQEDTTAGVMCLVIPCYSLFFALQNIDLVKKLFCLQIFGTVLTVIASIIAGAMKH